MEPACGGNRGTAATGALRKERRTLLRLRRLLISLALIYAAVVAALYFAQARILFSGWRSQGKAVARPKPPPGTRLLRLSTRDGTSIAALFGPALTPAARLR